MALLLVGLALFLLTHSISLINEGWRDRMVERFGEVAWKGGYSLASILGFALILVGYDLARQNPIILYSPPSSFHAIAVLLLVFVFPLLFATYLPGRIKSVTPHPMLTATTIWAFAHLLVSGKLANIVLFSTFLVWAVIDRLSMKRRTPRPIPTAPTTPINDLIAIIGGIGFYILFALWAHTRLVGVAPLSS